eukprot:1541817-Pleurochrysis_carterae.AAC.1
MGATGTPELREPSASAPRVRMQCECKLGNHACECQTANDKRARRQFVSKCRARARVELRVSGLKSKTLDNRPRSQYRWKIAIQPIAIGVSTLERFERPK